MLFTIYGFSNAHFKENNSMKNKFCKMTYYSYFCNVLAP